MIIGVDKTTKKSKDQKFHKVYNTHLFLHFVPSVINFIHVDNVTIPSHLLFQ